MTRDEIRFHCLELAHTHGHQVEEVLGRAEKYVEFVNEGSKVQTESPELKRGPGRPKKESVGNPDILG